MHIVGHQVDKSRSRSPPSRLRAEISVYLIFPSVFAPRRNNTACRKRRKATQKIVLHSPLSWKIIISTGRRTSTTGGASRLPSAHNNYKNHPFSWSAFFVRRPLFALFARMLCQLCYYWKFRFYFRQLSQQVSLTFYFTYLNKIS